MVSHKTHLKAVDLGLKVQIFSNSFSFVFCFCLCVYDDGLVCFCVVVRVWRLRALVIGGLSREGCLCVFCCLSLSFGSCHNGFPPRLGRPQKYGVATDLFCTGVIGHPGHMFLK